MFSNKRNNIINRNSCRLDVRNCLWSCTIGNRIFHISFQGISFAINKNFKGSLMLFSNLNYTFNGSRYNVIVNYDTPWNSTRLMQRIGRVNRIFNYCFIFSWSRYCFWFVDSSAVNCPDFHKPGLCYV